MGSSPLTRGKLSLEYVRNVPPGLIPAHAGKTRPCVSDLEAPAAHPRSRGENVEVDGAKKLRLGSSPLTRGKPSPPISSRTVRGLIPAHAGKTTQGSHHHADTRAHPRSRGENDLYLTKAERRAGSSPLTRGKPCSPSSSVIVAGLIPAHAGKTTFDASRCSRIRAHPRSRGENRIAADFMSEMGGSSPLTRGKRGRPVSPVLMTGLIPAHAGKTTRCTLSGAACAAHPRSRGENGETSLPSRAAAGSSPLTRGKHISLHLEILQLGLIPAHAGKTAGCEPARAASPAHPRSRGENDEGDPSEAGASGSSPLTRGKPRKGRVRPHGIGLIPAHAGKTLADGEPRRGPGAHPRSRGENATNRLSQISAGGSSPLTRGKRSTVILFSNLTGLIPAHAGKTWSLPPAGAGGRAHPRSRGENSYSSM